MSSSVLIIEDEQVLQDVYKLILSTNGYKVYTADNGIVGLQLLKKCLPDVVLLDLFMPVMDGKEFLRNMELADYPNTKVVVYTNLWDKETETEMLNLGATKYILKSSMSPQDLLDLVAGIIKLR